MKKELIEALFEKIFEVNDGLSIDKLLEMIKSRMMVYQKLHELCLKYLNGYDKWSSIAYVKQVNYNGRNYLVIKKNTETYLIIDIELEKSLSSKEVYSYFDENFFINHFNESKCSVKWTSMYWFLTYDGSIAELIKFYQENQNFLEGQDTIYESFTIGENSIHIYIFLNTGNSRLIFKTKDQLYKMIDINSNFMPFGIQDNIIKKEKIIEMISRFREAKIPFDLLPDDLKKPSNVLERKIK